MPAIRPLSRKLDRIAPSATTVLNERAIAMKRNGVDVFNFAVGEPDFPTPEHIKEAGMEAIRENITRYTPATGILDLKEAICHKLARDNGLEYAPNQIATTSGGKHALYNLLYVICDEGDEVLVPAPYWVSYPEMVKLAGAEPVVLNTDSSASFKVTAGQVRSAITPKTKALMLNTPSNPTGMVYTREELEAIAEVVMESGIYVITDELYEKILYDGHRHESIAALHPRMKEQALVVNGLSKAYAMTGWRLGYAAGPAEVMDLVVKFQGQTVMHPSAITQHAAITALTGPEDFLPPMIRAFDQRRNYIIERLEDMEGVTCARPGGAFYVFPDMSAYSGRSRPDGSPIGGSPDLAMYLLEAYQVVSAPGAAFGTEGCLRFSYATTLDVIEQGMDRVEKGLSSLTG
ncbi:MAG: pyridoxal phosphate-dependent aminotransferase [Gemmatimonadetes bacterium]|nr:pyridoxal phosphate-dependent aminotransferase [Gemmatimonadota bacterium]